MALNTQTNITDEVLVRLGVSTTVAFYTDAILKSWYHDAQTWANAYHKWPFTEVRDASTAWSGSETVEYTSFGPEFKSDSIRLLIIGTKRLQKLNFEDYQIFKEEQPSGTDRVFSDFNRTVYINPNADVSGTLFAYGQEQKAIDVTDETGTTPFSTYDQEGNDAIVSEMISYARIREKKPQEAKFYHEKAIEQLENVWRRILEEQSLYQTHPDRGGMFHHFDVLNGQGNNNDWFRENQF